MHRQPISTSIGWNELGKKPKKKPNVLPYFHHLVYLTLFHTCWSLTLKQLHLVSFKWKISNIAVDKYAGCYNIQYCSAAVMSICGKEVTEVAQPHPHQQLAGDYNYETGVYTFSMGGKSGWCQQTSLKWLREGFIKKKGGSGQTFLIFLTFLFLFFHVLIHPNLQRKIFFIWGGVPPSDL